MLWYIQYYWPSGFQYDFGIYHHWKVSVLHRIKLVLLSKEGVTQGAPMVMVLYALGTLSILEHLKHLQLAGELKE
eukprot:1390386-Ditylum_brightwellii.AAC.1